MNIHNDKKCWLLETNIQSDIPPLWHGEYALVPCWGKRSATVTFVHTATQQQVVGNQRSKWHWLNDWWLLITIVLFSALLSRLTAHACDSTWVTSFLQCIFCISTEVVYLSTGMAGATWNYCCLGTSSVDTIQPCHFMQSHIRKVYVCLAVTCHLHFRQNDRDLLHATQRVCLVPCWGKCS